MTSIQSEKDAKECFLHYNGDKHLMCDCCTEEDMTAYISFASEEKERIWRKEGFLEHYKKLSAGQCHRMYHFQKMVALYQGEWWEFLYQTGQILWACPLSEANAEKVARTLLEVADGDTTYPYTDEQRIAMFTLADSFVDKFQLKGGLVLYRQWHRIRILGVQNLTDAIELFRRESGFPQFRTTFAKECYDKLMTPEVLQEVSQSYFMELMEGENDDIRNFQTLFQLLSSEYALLNEQNIQALYQYLYAYDEHIRPRFWGETVAWIVQKLLPMLLAANYEKAGKDFLQLAVRLEQESAAWNILSYDHSQANESVLEKLREYQRTLLAI